MDSGGLRLFDRSKMKEKRSNLSFYLPFLTTSFIFLLFAPLYLNSILINDAGLSYGHEYLWSDWALHISLIRRIWEDPWAFGQWTHPVFAQAPLNYPIGTNWISAVLMRTLGLTIEQALQWPSLIYFGLLVAGTYRFIAYFVQAPWIRNACFILFWLGPAVLNVPKFMAALDKFPFSPDEGIRADLHWRSSHFFMACLWPQRSFLLGMCMAVLALCAFLKTPKTNRDRWLQIGALLLVAFLPAVHVHSFLMIAPAVGLFLLRNFKFYRTHWQWATFALFSMLLLLMVINAQILGKVSAPSMIRWAPWYGLNSAAKFLELCVVAAGVLVPLLMLGAGATFREMIAQQKRSEDLFLDSNENYKNSLLVSLLIFPLLAVFVHFQPTTWDNGKFFYWALLPGVILVWRGLEDLRIPNVRWVLLVLVFFHSSNGIVQVLRSYGKLSQRTQSTSRALIDLGEQIRKETPVGAVFLAAPAHDHWISVWAARSIPVTYPGWAINFGFAGQEREKWVRSIYEGAVPNISEELGRKNISFIVLGPDEKRTYPKMNESELRKLGSIRWVGPDGLQILEITSAQR